MRCRLRTIVLVIAMAGSSLWSSAAPDWTVYLRHAGPLRIGMSLGQVRQALHDQKAKPVGLEPEDPESCAYLESPAIPDGLNLMFLEGRLARFDVHEPGIRTASGIGVEDREERIQQLYPGRIKIEPHPYVDEAQGHYFVYSPADAADRGYGMVFETYAGKVTSFRAGTTEAVTLIEGCA